MKLFITYCVVMLSHRPGPVERTEAPTVIAREGTDSYRQIEAICRISRHCKGRIDRSNLHIEGIAFPWERDRMFLAMRLQLTVIASVIVMLSTFALLSINPVEAYAQSNKPFIKGTIANYVNQSLYLYKCYGDTLLLTDSIHTDKNERFIFTTETFSKVQNFGKGYGLYKVILQRNQWFYVLYDGNPIEIKTLFQPNAFYNIATDSLKVLKSQENKRFYEFQRLQQQLNVANYWLLQMLRLYPLPDPFHIKIEEEYFARYEAMLLFMKKIFAQDSVSGNSSPLGRLGGAYLSVLPDWKQPDPLRDSIIAAHYFDYFNPADSFYLHTNILPEKMDIYLALRTNKRDDYGQPVYNEMLFAEAAKEFLEKTAPLSFGEGQGVRSFCLNYFLKKFNKEHKDNAFLFLYDTYLKTAEGDCGTRDGDSLHFGKAWGWAWAREKASIMKGIQIGNIAPDFEIYPVEFRKAEYSTGVEKGKLSLSFLQSDYTLLLFWATWCPHCTQAVPEIKKAVDDFNSIHSPLPSGGAGGGLITVAISLDTDREQWQKFVTENNLLSFLNFSELKGWQSEVVKKYNVYATPTMFLLNQDKKIVAKPETAEQLINILTTAGMRK